MNVVFLVPVFNVGYVFEDWASRIYRLDPQPSEVVFCENNSTDNTLELIKESYLDYELIRIHTKDPRRIPFSKCYDIIAHTRDLLLSRARKLDPDFAIFLDSDILIGSPDFIDALITWDKDIVGGRYMRPFPEGLLLATLFFHPYDNNKRRLKKKHNELLTEVYATSAGCLCLSRKVIQDRRLSFYPVPARHSEDFGFCKKARELGYKVYLDGLVRLVHRLSTKRWKSWSTIRKDKKQSKDYDKILDSE